MLKFFFNKESKVVYTMEALGIVCLILLLATWWPSGRGFAQPIAFYAFIFEYLFIRACTIIEWYDESGRNTISLPRLKPTKREIRDTRYKGICLQFKKAMVPTSYIMPIFGGAILSGLSGKIIYIADILLLIIAHVNCILLYFHIKDREPMPVNFFTHKDRHQRVVAPQDSTLT